MAQRRMFSQDIVSSDAFLDMPVSSQVLYFHLAMRADDDGFVNPRSIMRLIGASNDDLRVLLSKRFLLTFETGVVVIKHWLIHNLIRADLYKETLYKKEKSTLGLNDNGAYTELREGVAEIKQLEAPEWLKRRRGEMRTANVPQTVPRIGKDRIGKDSVEEDTVAIAPPRQVFMKPTVEEITEYCSSRSNSVSPQRFFDFYESKGWKVGRERMKDWRAAVRTWEGRETKSTGQTVDHF